MWPVGRDAGSLRGHKVRRVYTRRGLPGDFYTLFKTIRVRAVHLYLLSPSPLSGVREKIR